MGRRSTDLNGVGLAAVLLALLLTGCGEKTASPAPDVYMVRGIIERLPAPNEADKSLYIHHAPIPGFRDEHGKVVGMMSMTMPFPVAAGVSLVGLAPGDPVEFTLTVVWKGHESYQISTLKKLPAGTVVDFQPR